MTYHSGVWRYRYRVKVRVGRTWRCARNAAGLIREFRDRENAEAAARGITDAAEVKVAQILHRPGCRYED